MAVFGGISTVSAAVLVHVGVTLHVTVQHRLVHARVVTLGAFEGFGSKVVTQVVLEVVLVLCDERTFWALQNLVVFDVCACMLPVLLLFLGNKVALSAAEGLWAAWFAACVLVFGVEVLDVALEAALRARCIVALWTLVLKMTVHV